MHDPGFDALWTVGAASAERFDPSTAGDLPPPARRYLTHSIAAGAPVATAARLRMHGEIKLGRAWCPFAAAEVIRWHRGFIWRARLKMKGLPVVGSDRWIDGHGSMRWRLLGVVPVASGDGPDISRSALGRVQVEALWLPTALLLPGAHWTALDHSTMTVQVPFAEQQAQVTLHVESDGRLRTASIARWGNPDEKAFAEHTFGGECLEETTFDGITIPTKLRIGWYFGTPRFETEGEFFRVTVDSAEFR